MMYLTISSGRTKGSSHSEGVLPETELNFYRENTYDVNAVGKQIGETFDHSNFTFIQKKVTWEDVVKEFKDPGICDLTLNSRALNRLDGFSGHRVVLIDITDTEVIFHDPNKDSTGAYRHQPLEHFRKVFESIEGPELARYWLE